MLLALLPGVLFGKETAGEVFVSTEGDPSTNISELVNILSGEFYINQDDLVVTGYQPIAVHRFYTSSAGALNLFPHTALIKSRFNYYDAKEPNGTLITYYYCDKSKKYTAKNSCENNITNTARGAIGGRTNLKNQTITVGEGQDRHIITLHCANGDKRIYHDEKGKILLQKELLANGNQVIYKYQDGKVTEIKTFNPDCTKLYASIEIKRSDDLDRIIASDGRELQYHYQHKSKKERLEKVRILMGDQLLSEELLAYNKDGKLCNRRLQDGQEFEILYYKLWDRGGGSKDVVGKRDFRQGRVKEVRAKISGRQSLDTAYTFIYEGYARGRIRWHRDYAFGKSGHVRDALGCIRSFDYSNECRPLSIEHKDPSQRVLYEERFDWKGSELQNRTYYVNIHEKLLGKQFFYDENYNVIQEVVHGNFTGNSSKEQIATQYKYNSDNQCIEKQEATGVITRYTYDKNLLKSIIVSHKEVILKRTFNEYDADNILVESREDAGEKTPCRVVKITPVQGFPQEVIEGYLDFGNFVQLAKRTYRYNKLWQIIEETHFDAQDRVLYTLQKEYDLHGRLILDTDPMGSKYQYNYDLAGNKVYEKLPSGLEKRFVYDASNRLITEIEKAPDGQEEIKRHTYDQLGRKTSTQNVDGSFTYYAYDFLGHCISVKQEDREFRRACNWQGYEVATWDGNGNFTEKKYNSFGKLVELLHPDKTKESWTYNLQGNPIQYKNPYKIVTEYEYDVLGRPVVQRIGDVIKRSEYRGFELVAVTDPMGNVRSFKYDGAGRKIAETFDGITLEYAYDSSSRLRETKHEQYSEIKEYDLCGRVVKEWIEDKKGKKLRVAEYSYDSSGNKIAVKRDSKTLYTYDAWNRLTSETDALGRVSRISYNPVTRTSKKIDPAGYVTEEIKDSFGKVKNRFGYTPSGERIMDEQFIYDKNGNKIEQVSLVYTSYGTTYPVNTKWKYDRMNRVISQIDADRKETQYEYSWTGKRETIRKPDGKFISYAHDFLDREDRLATLGADYYYTYDKLGRVIRIWDELTQEQMLRTYDARGNMLSETLKNGLTINRTYDSENRVTSLVYPDGSSVRYIYGALDLEKVIRLDAGGEELYEHSYLDYSQTGKLLKESHIHEGHTTSYSYDALDRQVKLDSPFLKHELKKFDLRDNLLLHTIDKENFAYTYDEYNQLTSEKSSVTHNYLYDSRNNRLEKDEIPYTADDLDELLQAGKERFEHDLNGNRTGSGEAELLYDGMDRLIAYKTAKETIEYSYDAWHRRMTKTVNGVVTRYLYDHQNEIGSCSDKKNELRILGQGKGAEIGSAVAIEIDKEVYIPQHDLFGNVKKLIAAKPKIVIESYTYTAYGEEKDKPKTAPINPWRFSSKRHDSTGLIYYGRRYYDPAHGRWISPDPAHDGPNRYAFLRNHPLCHFDLYGLFTFPHNKLTAEFFTVESSKPLTGAYPLIDPLGNINVLDYKADLSKAHLPFGRISYNNGMFCSRADMTKQLGEMYKLCGSSLYHFTWSPAGFGDIVGYPGRRTGEKLGFPSVGTENVYKQYLDFHIATKNQPDARFLQICFSRGTGDVEAALKLCSDEMRNKIIVRGYGGEKIIDPSLAGDVKNYVAQGDPIPWVSKSWSFFIRGDSIPDDLELNPFLTSHLLHIKYLMSDSKNSGFSHQFEHETYKKQWVKDIKEFKESYNVQ